MLITADTDTPAWTIFTSEKKDVFIKQKKKLTWNVENAA